MPYNVSTKNTATIDFLSIVRLNKSWTDDFVKLKDALNESALDYCSYLLPCANIWMVLVRHIVLVN